MEGTTTFTPTCVICGATFEGEQAEAKLRGHMMHHYKEKSVSKEGDKEEMEPEKTAERQERQVRNEHEKPYVMTEKQRVTEASRRAAELRERRDRKPVSSMQLTWPAPAEKDGFTYHVFNDNWQHKPNRVQKAKDAGWEVVDAEVQNCQVGSNDDGSKIKGVLMRIPTEIYEEDQREKHRNADEAEKQIFGGSFLERPEHKRYVPKNGIRQEVSYKPPV